MASWKEILDELKAVGSAHDVIRRRYIQRLHQLTGRNVIAYYSGWLQKPQLGRVVDLGINDNDKNGFMAAIHNLDRSRGLDLILHTPGGAMAATESVIDYLRSMFGTDIRALVPQIAMSGGTMMALACKEIVMGKHSSLGPIDPQIDGKPAHGIIEEFSQAAREIKRDPTKIAVWQPIIANYNPTLIGECRKAIKWAEEITADWLRTGMFKGDPKAKAKARKIITGLGKPALTKSHSRHISLKGAQDLGLKILPLEPDPALQEAILSVHHVFSQTLGDTAAYKIIENHSGAAFISRAQIQVAGK